MNQTEFANFTAQPRDVQALTVDELANKTPRTLIYGYTVNRNTFHTYLCPQTNLIVRLIYEPRGFDDTPPKILSHITGPHWKTLSCLIPDKRIYPEASDLEFCRILKTRGFHLSFTEFNAEREQKLFHGFVLP